MMLRTNSSNNTVYADDQGNIAYWHGDFMPKRDTKFDWNRPLMAVTPLLSGKACIHFDYSSHSGQVAVFKCEDCGCYHLTSKGTVNPKLAAFIYNGQLRRQKGANRWLDKLKRK